MSLPVSTRPTTRRGWGPPTSFAPDSVQSNDYTTRSAFVGRNLSFSSRVIATVGVRHDWLDITTTDELPAATTQADFLQNSFRGALTYKLSAEISTYASYVQSVAPPSIGTQPERGEQYELETAPNQLASLWLATLTRAKHTALFISGETDDF